MVIWKKKITSFEQDITSRSIMINEFFLSFFKRQFIQDIQNSEGIKYINPESLDENKEKQK